MTTRHIPTRHSLRYAAMAAAFGFMFAFGVVQAQTPNTGGKPAAKKQAPAKAAPPKGLAPLSAEQIDTSRLVHGGKIQCEFGATIFVALDPKHPGYVDVQFGKLAYKGVPTLSRTGALRVEDDVKGVLWLQLGNKSMLMDVKRGQRLADDCVHEEHRKAIAAAVGKPADNILEAKPAAVPASGAAPGAAAPQSPQAQSPQAQSPQAQSPQAQSAASAAK